MANMNIRSSEYAWHQTEVKVLNRTVQGITGFEFKKSVEKEAIYGAGQNPIDIQEGNVTCEGSLTLTGFELDRINQAAQSAGYDDILSVPHETVVIVATMRKTAADPITVVTARGVAFTEYAHSMSQGDKKREVSLPFIAMDIVNKTVTL